MFDILNRRRVAELEREKNKLSAELRRQTTSAWVHKMALEMAEGELIEIKNQRLAAAAKGRASQALARAERLREHAAAIKASPKQRMAERVVG